MTDFSVLEPVIDTVVITVTGGAITWLANHIIQIMPALSGVITASRVQQAEEAISNVLVSKVNDIASGKTTIQAEAKSAMSTLSTQARAAMDGQGTTEEMLAARAIGNALVKIGTVTATPPVANSTTK